MIFRAIIWACSSFCCEKSDHIRTVFVSTNSVRQRKYLPYSLFYRSSMWITRYNTTTDIITLHLYCRRSPQMSPLFAVTNCDVQWSRNIVVAIVTRLRAGCPRNRCPIPCIRNVQNNLLFFDTGAYSRGIERLEREVENTRPASESAECVELYIQYPYAFMARTGTTVLMPSDMFCVYSQLH